jgi:hypothetical protein
LSFFSSFLRLCAKTKNQKSMQPEAIVRPTPWGAHLVMGAVIYGGLAAFGWLCERFVPEAEPAPRPSQFPPEMGGHDEHHGQEPESARVE